VVALSTKSAAREEGVVEAMIMTHINKVDVLGWPQEEILEALKKQAGTVRHIRFTSLAGSSRVILGSALEGDGEQDAMSVSSSKSTPALLGGKHAPASASASAAASTATDVTKLSGFPSVLDAAGRIKKPASVSPSKLARLASMDGGVLDPQSLTAGAQGTSTSTNTSTNSISKRAVAHEDWEAALHTRPANSTVKSTAAVQRVIVPIAPLPYATAGAPLTPQHYIGARGMMLPVAAKPVLPQPGPQPGQDPFSTPARRRRIVADVSRFLLKQYCVKACENVVYLRKANKAATKIQCLWRRYFAKKRLLILHYRRQRRAAKKIQQLARIFLARKELARRRAAYLHKIRLHLALHLQHFWRALKLRRKQLLDGARERAALIARRQGKKSKAAVQIEKGARGMLARILVRKLKDSERLRQVSATKIQAVARRRRAEVRLRALRTAYKTICIKALMWWLRRKWKRGTGARRIQRAIRGGLARLRCRRMREAIEIARLAQIEQEERRKQEIKFQQAVSAAAIKSEEESSLKVQLHARLELRMLRHLAAMGPRETVAWAVSCGVVRFRNTLGYSLGDAALQVLGVVNTCYPKRKAAALKGGGAGAGEGLYEGEESKEVLGVTHIIEQTPEGTPLSKPSVFIDAWREINGKSDKPPEEILPLRWAQVVGITRRVQGNGVELSVARDQRSIKIIIQMRASKFAVKAVTVDVVSPLTLSATAPIKFTPVTTVCIVLEGQERETGDIAPIITPASGIIYHKDCPASIFEHQGVCVSLPQAEKEEEEVAEPEPELVIASEPVPEPEPEPEVESDAEAENESFGSMDDDIDSVPDFDSFACIIQFAYRRYLRPRILAVMALQHQWRRMKTLNTWYKLVEVVWQRAVKSVLMIQRCGLGHVARKRVAYMRDAAIFHLYSEFEHIKEAILHGAESANAFLKDEEDNWKVFGMCKPSNLPQDVRALPQFQGRGQRPAGDGGSYVLGEAGFDVYDDSQVVDTKVPLQSQAKTAGVQPIRASLPDATGVLMYSAPSPSFFSETDSKSVRSQMLRAIQLPESPSDCLHPLCKLSMSSAVLGEPWNVFADFELGVQLPLSPEDSADAYAEVTLPPIYIRTAERSFA